MSRASRFVLVTAATALAMAGCADTVSGDAKTATADSSPGTSGATSSSPPTSNAVSGPHQTPNSNTDGTTFDPCVAYSAAELSKWGLDPATVKGVDDGLQRGCIWNGKGWYVQQLVANRSISEYLDTNNYPDAQPLTIAGLQGSQHRLSQPGTGFCSVQVPSQKAVVATLVNVDAGAATRIPDACTKAIEIATDTVAKLPK